MGEDGSENQDRRSISVRLEGENLERFGEIEQDQGSAADAVRFLIQQYEVLNEDVDELRRDRDSWREIALSLKDDG